MINSKPNKNAATEKSRLTKVGAGAAVPKVGKIISRPLSLGNAPASGKIKVSGDIFLLRGSGQRRFAVLEAQSNMRMTNLLTHLFICFSELNVANCFFFLFFFSSLPFVTRLHDNHICFRRNEKRICPIFFSVSNGVTYYFIFFARE